MCLITDYLENKGYSFLGAGGSRSAYLSPNKKWVVKVPNTTRGERDNEKEVDTARNGYPYPEVPLAKCRLATVLDVKLSVMEYINPAIPEFPSYVDYFTYEEYNRIHEAWVLERNRAIASLPDWVKWTDQYQVGYDRRGKLVCYDYDCW